MVKELEELKELFEEAPVDFLGTGNDSKYASKEEDDWRQRYEDKLEDVDALIRKLTHKYFTSSEFQDEFNNIADLRYYIMHHPNQEMIKLACLWFLGLDEIDLNWIQHSKTIVNDVIKHNA